MRRPAPADDHAVIASINITPLIDVMLASAIAERPDPTLVMQTDPDARYDRFHGVLAVVKNAGVRRLGFAGNRPVEF